MFKFRYYQAEARKAVSREWENHTSTAVIMPTATGKTWVYLSIAVERPGRTLVLVHRDYLITSPIAQLAGVGFTDVDIEKADSKSEDKQHKAQIVFASVQSMSIDRRLNTFDPKEFSTLIVDEAHRAVSPTYRRVLDYFRERNRKLKVLLMTATPKRKDGIGLMNVCDTVAYNMTPGQAADGGWIPRPRFMLRDVASLDFSKVTLRAGDLNPEEAAAAALEEKPLHEICASLAETTGPTIVFCPLVKVAQAYAELLDRRYRIGKAMAVHMDSTPEEMERATKGLADGTVDFVFNVDKFTEGFDVPKVARVAWTSGTASLVRWTQGCGRSFRPDSSIAHLLVGGPEDSETRRQLILDSPKPYSQILTYVPSNCQHKICSAVDLLGGHELPADVKDFAEMIQEDTARLDAGSETNEDIETAEIFVNLRNTIDAARKAIKATATYRDAEFDGMGGGQTHREVKQQSGDAGANVFAAAASFSGDPASEKQVKWFQWKKINVPAGMTKFQASVVRDLITAGVNPATAFGYPKGQALKVRDSYKKLQEVTS